MERRNLKQSCVAILLTMLLGMVGEKAIAHDIAVANQDGVTIYYSWINNNTELAVSCEGDSHDAYADEYSGNIVIPESVLYGGQTYKVTSIGSCAFYDCTGVTSVTIPNSVTSIGTMAFAGCSSLTSIYVEAIDPPKLELYWVFDGVDENKCVLYVPKGCVDKYRSEMIWGSFKNIVEH